MDRIALLVLVPLLAAGCSNSKPEERKLPGSAAPTTTTGSAAPPTTTGSGATGSGSAGSGSAGPGTPGPRATGFASFDEAMAGTRPWIAADDKGGVVELVAVDDLSGRTKGQFSVDLRCGPDAQKAVEAIGKRMVERLTSNHEPPACKEAGGVTSCFQRGLAEGDVSLEIQYGKAADAWRAIGVRTIAVGVTAAKEEARYAALLKEKCK